MPKSEQAIFRWIRRMTAEASCASDAQLLDRFVVNRDEAAFELLLWRHARLVFGVCLRVLHDWQDAEDAFQATFLALARRAGRINKREAIASWLHKVAYRVSLTAQARRARRDASEKRSLADKQIHVSPEAEASLENQELRGILDQEIGRLPERFRSAVVLCYLEGKSVDEAAVLLGCPRGTVASRLARARARLTNRLAGRGLVMTAAVAIPTKADAFLRPLSLIPVLTTAALRYAATSAAADGGVSPRIISLTEEVLRAMFLNKIKTGILVAFLGILLAGGGLAVGLHAQGDLQAQPPTTGEKTTTGKEHVVDKPAAQAPHPVTVGRPMRRQAVPYQDYAGRLEAHQAVEVRPAMSGFVQKICFKAGAEVKKGDVLFELDARASQLALEKTQAELTAAVGRKTLSDADIQHVRRKVQVERNVQAGRDLQDEMDRATERAAAAQASVTTAKLDVERAALELEATKVKAPMSGTVGRPLVEPGTLIFRGQDNATLMTTVTSLDPITLYFDMDERSLLDYRRLVREKRVKEAGNVLRMGLAGEDGFPHEGTLESFEGHVNPRTGTVGVRGTFPNPGQLLLPGMFARVRMTLGPLRAVLEVPEQAVLSDQGKKYVLVVNDRNIAERREISQGALDNGMSIVENGLHEEDLVVVGGHQRLRPGDTVEPEKHATPKR
jgi:RND family efflux transporter MFP subunit